MEWTKKKLSVALSITAIVAVSLIALLGIPHAAGAAKVTSPAMVSRAAPVAVHCWFAPLVAPAFGPSSVTTHTVCPATVTHSYGLRAAGATASAAQGSVSQTPFHEMHHCGFMPRYNQLRA
jgi:hypothetical protein